MKRTKIGELNKLRPNNKTVHDTRTERDAGRARLLNFSTQHKVEIFWDLNEEAIADRMFKLRIGDNEAILSSEDIRRFLRWI